MRLRAPAGCTGASVDGVLIAIDAEGFADVDPAHLEALRSHGFDVADKAPAAEPASPRAEMIESAVALCRAQIEAMSDEDLEHAIAAAAAPVALEHGAAAEPDESETPPADEPGFDPASAGEDDIDAMNRNELFAFLRARDIQAVPPITNAELRRLAREGGAA